MDFAERLERDLVGHAEARFVCPNNSEAEHGWSVGEPELPGADIAIAGVTVNRMQRRMYGALASPSCADESRPQEPAHRFRAGAVFATVPKRRRFPITRGGRWLRASRKPPEGPAR
jgi:hypothetical protein